MKKRRIAIVGAGVSGLTCAQLLKDRHDVTVFEKETTPGGLIRCERVRGSLFHVCGGHVFNTKNQRVQDWFWSKFSRDEQFVRAVRHSAVCLDDGRFVDYPIENHVWQLPEKIQKPFYADLEEMARQSPSDPRNFDEFLRKRFGRTLYNLYFKPYNDKVWRRDLREIPLSWLEGKLPMPTVEEMRAANRDHLEERSFVHSSFYYAKSGGSQLIADTLANDACVKYGVEVQEIAVHPGGRCAVNGETFDDVIFCGNLKELPTIMPGFEWGPYRRRIGELESHGTTSVFCEFDKNPYSWFYQTSPAHRSHRFICTGNFSPNNNALGKMTGTVEFTDEISIAEILHQLPLMPFHPKYLVHRYNQYTYPIQHADTRKMVNGIKRNLAQFGVRLVGRFAEWEYFNMDAAMASAMACCDTMMIGA